MRNYLTHTNIGEAFQRGVDHKHRNAFNKLRIQNERNALSDLNAQREGRKSQAEIDFVKGGVQAILSSPEEQRPQMYQGFLSEYERQGFDARQAPQEYHPKILEALAGAVGVSFSQPKDSGFTLSQGQTRFDAQGNTLASLEPKSDEKGFDNEAKLRGEFTKLSGDFQKQNAAFGRIQASANNPSAAGDLSLIFNYMKLLDPGSTVREGEFATAQNSGGVNDRIRSTYNQMINGERLTEAQRADFFSRSKSLFGEATRQHDSLRNKYSVLAKRNRLDPENVVIDLRTADPSREINLGNAQERKVINGESYLKIDGQWFKE